MESFININLIAIIFFSILAILILKLKLNKYVRIVTLIASVSFLGFYLKNCICPIGAFQYIAILKKDIFSIDNLNFLLMFSIPVLFTIFFGRIFCGTVCPMGAFQELLFKIGTKLKINNGDGRFKKINFLIYFKYFFMISIIVFSFISGVAVFCGFEPFYTLFNFSGTVLSTVILTVVIITSFVKSRPWCRIVCPYGALLSLFSIGTSFISKKLNLKIVSPTPIIEKSCKHCGLCSKKCTVGAIKNEIIDSAECISCGECKKVCNFNSIK